MNPFAQISCARCGATVWVPTATGVGYCPQCHAPTQLQPGAAAGSASAPAQGIAATVAIPAMATPPGVGAPQGASAPWAPTPNPGMASQPNVPFGAGQPGAFGTPAQGAYGAPQQGAYGAPAQGTFGAPPQVRGYVPPQEHYSPQGGYAPPGAFPQQGTYGPAGGFPAAGGLPRPSSGLGALKFVLPALAAIAVACIGTVATTNLRRFLRGGRRSLSSYNITKSAADPDAMIRAAGELAREWRSDAVFSSINIIGMRTDGTVDLTSSSNTVTVEYFSPARVSSFLERERRDSIKKYVFASSGVHYDTVWGVRRRVERPVATPTPTCGARQLGTVLAAQGVPPTATLHVQYDPQFAFAVNGALAWHVTSSNPLIDRWYDVGSCTFLRGR